MRTTRNFDGELGRRLRSMPEQLEEALSMELPKLPKKTKICVCGLGNSATAGDIVSDFVNQYSKTQVVVVRNMEIPKWAGQDTMVILVSYSGNTREVRNMFKTAVRRKCAVVCVTSGGALMDLCRENGRCTLVQLPGGMPPRAAMGYLVGALGMIFEKIGVCEFRSHAEAMLPRLKRVRDELETEENAATEIVDRIGFKIPVVYSLSNMRPVSLRWKSQINENSSTIAFCGTIPGFNHNEIIGWTEDGLSDHFLPIIIYDTGASELIRGMTDTTLGVLRDSDLDLYVYYIDGDNNLEKSLICVLLGDYVSLRLADRRDVDPNPDTVLSTVIEGTLLDETAE
ncbi:MAG: hypothetical protein GX224_04995 [Thermoplasmatales archaeon]|nr:hypothetical protein [Thermoplasmatales archaeon]